MVASRLCVCVKSESFSSAWVLVFFLLPGKLYGDPDYLEERHRHRFEVNPVLKKCLEEQGLKFVGQDVGGR